MRTVVALALVFAAVGQAGCAPRPVLDPRPGMSVTEGLLRADALVERGCLGCLRDALAIFERLAADGRAAEVETRVIDTLLLLALRERELGLARERSLERAAELAARQPAPYDIGLFVTVAGVQVWHPSGVSNERAEEGAQPLRRMAVSWREWRDALRPHGTRDLVRASYLLSLDCAAGGLLSDARIDP